MITALLQALADVTGASLRALAGSLDTVWPYLGFSVLLGVLVFVRSVNTRDAHLTDPATTAPTETATPEMTR